VRTYALLASTAFVALTTAGASGTWGKAPRLPTPRSAHAVVVAAGAIHVLGGPGGDRVDRFDGHTWSLETHLPGGIVNAPVAVALGTKLYAIGGFLGATNLPTADVWVFDLSARTWSAGPPLPAPVGGAAAVVLGGRIHVLGGGNNVSTVATHYVLDPNTGQWTTAAQLPRAEGSPAAVVRGGKIYAIGGRSGFSDFGNTYIYDPAADAWTRGPSIPPRGTAGAAVWRGSIYLFGGESQSARSVLGGVFRLAPGARAWRRIGRLPTPRNYARAVVFRRRIYIVGGSKSAGDSHAARGSRVVEWLAPR
jgi:N-acetylneuraminic acid mutarotase